MTNPRFCLVEVNVPDGFVTVRVRKDLVGTVANHLRDCPEWRKGCQAARAMGFALQSAGHVLFNNDEFDLAGFVRALSDVDIELFDEQISSLPAELQVQFDDEPEVKDGAAA